MLHQLTAFYDSSLINAQQRYYHLFIIKLSEKCLSFTDTSFTTTHLYINMKLNPSNVVIFILIEQNGSHVIR